MASFFGKSGKPILNRLSQSLSGSFSRQCTGRGASHDGRLHLSGKINGVPVSVLVATGADQNVISERLTAIAAAHEFVLELGEDYRTNIKAQVKELEPNVDAIVGLPWLMSLGEVSMSFNSDKPEIEFWHEGKKISLTGI